MSEIDFKILANEKDITALIRDRLLSLRITDAAGESSDTVNIELDNRDNAIDFPSTGATLDVFIGKKDALIFKGAYEVNELIESLDDYKLSIHGKAAKFKSSFKAPKSSTYDDITFGELLEKIASAHRYEYAISSELAAIQFTHIDQVNESDMNLLTRLARDNNAVAKPVANKLVVIEKGKSKTVSGQELPTITITDSYNSSGSISIQERNDYKSVSARYFDETKQSEQIEKVGEGEPCFAIGRLFNNKEEAAKAAEARLKKLQRGKANLSLTRPLSPEIIPEYTLEISGHKKSVNGTWKVESIEHLITSGTYASSSMQCTIPT